MDRVWNDDDRCVSGFERTYEQSCDENLTTEVFTPIHQVIKEYYNKQYPVYYYENDEIESSSSSYEDDEYDEEDAEDDTALLLSLVDIEDDTDNDIVTPLAPSTSATDDSLQTPPLALLDDLEMYKNVFYV